MTKSYFSGMYIFKPDITFATENFKKELGKSDIPFLMYIHQISRQAMSTVKLSYYLLEKSSKSTITVAVRMALAVIRRRV